MSKIVIFGGTTEGRLLAEYCAGHGIQSIVCVVSEYGHQVLPESPYLQVRTEPMDKAAMEDMLLEKNPRLVLDATHPYAAVVTKNILAACEKTGMSYQRISRSETGEGWVKDQSEIHWVHNVKEAVEFLADTKGPVFVTTGSKELLAYTELPDYQERLYVRVLPGEEIMAACKQAGISGKHIMAMQGPFSKEMNTAMLNHIGARYLVTKEAGKAGGFLEKIEAAQECQVIVVVIGRPEKPEGISVEEGIELLTERLKKSEITEVNVKETSRHLNLIGIGMGGSRQLTIEVIEQLKKSDVVLGAPRMLESIREVIPNVPKEPYYLSKDVLSWLKEHSGYHQISVVYSGDTGFYSGAKTLLEELTASEMDKTYQIKVFPGISTVSYLCAKLGVSWDDAYLASAHGREYDVVELLKKHKKVFLLLGGEHSVQKLCKELTMGGLGHVQVSVGERLSYPEERVITGASSAFIEERFEPLVAVLLRR